MNSVTLQHQVQIGPTRTLQDVVLAECRQPDPTMGYFCPMSRYCAWDLQVDETKSWLTDNLGYNESIWNLDYDYDYSIESLSYEELDEVTQNNLGVLFSGDEHDDEEQHDCCLNHYNSYYWADFESYSQEILEAMGYDQNSWDNGLPTEYDDMFWGKLPESVKEAAKELCYSAEIWNGIKSIDEWDDDVELPGSYSLYSENWLIALIQQLFAALLGLFS